MAQKRDAKGRFASGTGARTGQLKGIRARQSVQDSKNVVRNTKRLAEGTSNIMRGGSATGIRVSRYGMTAGSKTVRRPIGEGTARTLSRRGSVKARARSRAMVEKTLKNPGLDAKERRSVKRRAKWLGPLK
jgi:hypothetical protein